MSGERDKPPVALASVQNHAPDSTPPIREPSMEPIMNIAERLLGLRGSPPGTLASLGEHEIKLLCNRARPILLDQVSQEDLIFIFLKNVNIFFL